MVVCRLVPDRCVYVYGLASIQSSIAHILICIIYLLEVALSELSLNIGFLQ